MATYTPDIPQPTDIPSQSQGTIANNFTAINDQFSVDHAGMVTPATGFHNKVTFPEGTAANTPMDTITLYSKDTNTRPTLFLRQENNGAEIQMSGPTPTNAQNGYTFLPGGLLLQWGINSLVPDGGTGITFPTAFGTTVYSIVANEVYAGSGAATSFIAISSRSSTSFTPIGIRPNGSIENGSRNVFWQAIGTI